MCPSLLLIISIRFNLFKIGFLGDNGSAFSLDSGDGGGTLLRDMIGTFIAFGFLDFIFLILFILVAFRFFSVFLVVTLSFKL